MYPRHRKLRNTCSLSFESFFIEKLYIYFQENKCAIKPVPFRGVNCSDAAGSEINYSYIMTSLLPKSSTGRIWDQKTLSPYFNFVNNVSMYSCIGRWITFPDFIIDFLFRELLWHAKDTKHLWANDVIKHQPFRRKEIMIIWIFSVI